MTLRNGPARCADRVYHDLLTPPDALAVRREVRDFAERALAPIARELAQGEESVALFPRALFREMAGAGLFAIPFRAADQGRGLAHRVSATAVTIEELAYFSNSVAAIYDVHCILAGRTLERGSEAIRREYLAPVIAGTKIGAFATTEPLASTDLSPKALKTRAVRQGERWIVNGRKRFITNAPVADFVVCLAGTEAGPTELVIDLKAPGVSVGPPDRKLGNRAQLTADIVLENVAVPAENVIGAPGEGLRVALATLTYGRIGIAATGVGMAQSAFDQAMAHLGSREAFGRKIGAFQHWQFKMAERATQLENARNLTLKAARRMDDGVEFPEPEAAMAKSYATELAVDMARDAIQALGGYGFMRSLGADGTPYDVEAIYRDAKIAEIYEGTNEIQRLIIARTLFGKELTG
jgi:butyryl-CoA dehydrogenase